MVSSCFEDSAHTMPAWLKYDVHHCIEVVVIISACSLMNSGTWGCRQWLWYAMPAFFFCLLLAAFYNDNTTTCSSCGTTWRSLSFHTPTLAPPPERGKHEDEELKGGIQVYQSFNTSFENPKQDSESPGGQGFIGSVPKLVDKSRKAGNGTQSVAKLPTPPAELQGHKIPRKLERALFRARQAIANAGANTDSYLYAPLYHNLSMFIKSYELMEQMFKIYVYEDGSQPLVHAGPTVGIYASEGRFIQQLQNSKRFTTRDPEKAHMFFLPYSVEHMVSNLYVPNSHDMRPLINFITSYVNSIASNYPFWNQSHGADHFFAACHDWGPATTRRHPELMRNSIKVVCNADVSEGFVVGRDVSLPETFMHGEKPPTKMGGPSPRKRPYLAFFAGRMHGRVRPVLLKYWKDKEPDMKMYETVPGASVKTGPYKKLMRSSKFCICPMGYEVNSPRIVEAIYYDCVPVIIADKFVLPFSEVLKWDAFSVVVKEEELPQLKQILMSIPARRYRSLQATLKHVRKHFLWHYQNPTKYDIFHMILHSVWLSRLASLPPSLS